MGTTEDAHEYNRNLWWILDVIRDQMVRPGNQDFKFTIEAPVGGNAQHILMLKAIELEVCDGGPGGKVVEVHYCKFGVDYEKKTFLWTNIESLIKDSADRKCTTECPCKLGKGNHKVLGRDAGPASAAAAFPHELCTYLKMHVEKACGHRRRDNCAVDPVCPK